MGDVIWNKAGISEYESSLAVWTEWMCGGGEWSSVEKEREFLDNEQISIYYQVVRKGISTWTRRLKVTSSNLSVLVRVGWSYSTPLFQLLTSCVRWRPIAGVLEDSSGLENGLKWKIEKIRIVSCDSRERSWEPCFWAFICFVFFFFFGLLISVNPILQWSHLHLFLITSQLQELLRKNVFLQVQRWECTFWGYLYMTK